MLMEIWNEIAEVDAFTTVLHQIYFETFHLSW